MDRDSNLTSRPARHVVPVRMFLGASPRQILAAFTRDYPSVSMKLTGGDEIRHGLGACGCGDFWEAYSRMRQDGGPQITGIVLAHPSVGKHDPLATWFYLAR
jgi:hypothetical protein